MHYQVLNNASRDELLIYLASHKEESMQLDAEIKELEAKKRRIELSKKTIENRLAQINRVRNKTKPNQSSVESNFVTIAKENLPQEFFKSILQKAQERAFLEQNDKEAVNVD